MAKVTGPLMSMDARGKFGGTIVFSGWKGRATVRQLVTPANPMSANQTAQRNMVRTGGAIQRFANLCVLKGAGRLVTDKAALTAAAPAGQAWNGFLVNSLIGAGSLNYTAGQAAWAATTSGNKTTWDGAAAALNPAISAVNQTIAGGGAGTPLTAGNAFYLHVYALYKAGIGSAPVAATPPTYA